MDESVIVIVWVVAAIAVNVVIGRWGRRRRAAEELVTPFDPEPPVVAVGAR